MALTLDPFRGQLPAELKTALEKAVNPLSYSDGSGTPGNATANTETGRHAVAIGASACVVTNSLVAANSVVNVTLESRDATAITPVTVPAAGSFTVTFAANATAATRFRWSLATRG